MHSAISWALPICRWQQREKAAILVKYTRRRIYQHLVMLDLKSAKGAMGKYQVRLYRTDDVRVGKRKAELMLLTADGAVRERTSFLLSGPPSGLCMNILYRT